MIPDRKYPFRITFMTTPEQSAYLDGLAAASMTNVSSVVRQIIHHFSHAGGTAPRPNGHAENREIA